MPSTAHIVALLDDLLGPGSEELRPHPDVRTLALALDPPPSRLLDGADAVLVHRSHGADPPPGIGLLGCHDPFDRALGLAHNRVLHADLGCRPAEELDEKLTVADAPDEIEERLTRALQGAERPAARRGARRVAFADAMRPALVEQAARAGADLYVTGAWRPSAQDAVRTTGIDVLVVGHRRQEAWSLHRLARLLDDRQEDLQTMVCTR